MEMLRSSALAATCSRIIFGLMLIVSASARAQSPQIDINKLPVPSYGSMNLSTGDTVPANRLGVTYGLTAGWGGNCAANQFVNSINAQGVPVCAALPNFSSVFLGTTASSTNPGRNGDVSTGLFSAAPSTVSVAVAGVTEATFSSTGLSAQVTSTLGSTSATLANRFAHWMNVVDDCGVAYNGTDQTTALNACEGLANAAGVCMYFPAGTVTGTMTYKSNDCLIGEQGPFGQTIIKQPNSKNATAVLGSFNAAALWGTSSNGGVANSYIENITINGNKANNTTSDCIDLYGYNPVWNNVSVENCPVYGIRTEYGPGTNTAFGFEGYFTNIKTDTTGQDGWYFGGPHDSQIINAILIDSSQTTTNTYTGFEIYNSSSVTGVNIHPWRRGGSNDTKYALWDHGNGGSRFVQSFFEGADTASVRFDVGNDEISGGSFIYPTSYAGNMTGVVLNSSNDLIDATIICNASYTQTGVTFGDSSHTSSSGANKVDGDIVNCQGGIADYTHSQGNNIVQVVTYNVGTYPAIFTGTPVNTDLIVAHGSGPGAGNLFYTGGNLTIPYNFNITSYGQTYNTLMSTGFNGGTDYTALWTIGSQTADANPTLDIANDNLGVGIGTATPNARLEVEIGSSTPIAKFETTGSNGAQVIIDNTAGGNQSTLNLVNAGTTKWQLVKNTDNTFAIYDDANSHNIIYGTTAGLLQLGENQSLDVAASGLLVGIGSTIPRTALDLSSTTDALILPIGTTGLRPATGVNGMVRYNGSNANVEAYANNIWTPVFSQCTTVAATGSSPQTASCAAGFYITGGICADSTIADIAQPTTTGGLAGSITCTKTSDTVTATAYCCH